MEANEGTSAPQHLRQHGIQEGDVADAVAWVRSIRTKDPQPEWIQAWMQRFRRLHPQRENSLPSAVDLVRELRDED
jgi:hypothetical protein